MHQHSSGVVFTYERAIDRDDDVTLVNSSTPRRRTPLDDLGHLDDVAYTWCGVTSPIAAKHNCTRGVQRDDLCSKDLCARDFDCTKVLCTKPYSRIVAI